MIGIRAQPPTHATTYLFLEYRMMIMLSTSLCASTVPNIMLPSIIQTNDGGFPSLPHFLQRYPAHSTVQAQ
jgi:hypothetical protein